ncbi:BAR-domain-containing protein, partial [Fistulina hepatica ATCC 64428]
WAGEVISSREKTELSDEFRQLEMDIELRREGTKRLQAAADVFYHTLSKKKECEALDDPDKLLPIDALGIAQITHGEAYDSAYGSALVTLGRAHCKIATQQDTFAMTFQDTYLKSHSTFLDEIKEYDVQRKKLESRRLSYDAAITKFEKHKNSRKEKAKREVEEEMERAQFRYEETCEDVRAHMHSVQESEVSQLRELTALLDNEIKFVRQWLNVLEDARSDWP